MTSTSEMRCEIKFVDIETEYAHVRQWLLLNTEGFRVAYPARAVNNVYFDTFDCGAYFENLSGASRRTKVRFRWYGESSVPERGVLEVKQKRNHLGWKINCKIGSPLPFTERWPAIVSRIKSELPPAGRLWLDSNPSPVLINRYRREYFISADSRVRVTLDRDQRVFDQRYNAVPNLTNAANLPAPLVMELKYAPEHRDHVTEILRAVPIRMSRNSKYTLGVTAIHGF